MNQQESSNKEVSETTEKVENEEVDVAGLSENDATNLRRPPTDTSSMGKSPDNRIGCSSTETVENLLAGGTFSEKLAHESSINERQRNETARCATAEISPVNFENRGLALWETSRSEWLNNSRGKELYAKELPVDDIINALFSASSSGSSMSAFPQNVPLAQMVDLLQDLWEAEGLDV